MYDKRHEKPTIKCPYFCGEGRNIIKCGPGVVCSMRGFASRADRDIWKSRYCTAVYSKCPEYRTVTEAVKAGEINA